jgi:hypothetical protein
MKERLDGIRPTKNAGDFEHYRLMLDIRINYLRFKQIEAIYESSSYTRAQAVSLAERLEEVLEENARLDECFTTLNSGYLKDEELVALNASRGEKMKALHRSLKNNRQQ